MASVTRSGTRWRAQVRMAGAPARSKSFATKQEAARWAREQEGAIVQGRSPQSVPRVTIADAIDAYHRSTVAPPSPTRARVYNSLRSALGDIRVASMAPTDIINHALRRARSRASPSTVLMDLMMLRGVLKQGLIMLGVPSSASLAIISDAVAHLRHMGVVAASNERDRRVGDEELQVLRDYWASQPRLVIPMWDITRFAIATTMRQGEITRISWDTFDAGERTIAIPDRKHPTMKRGNTQRVPLLTFTTVCGETVDPVALMGAPARGRVFPFVPASVSDAFTRSCAACGIKDLRFHDLRHEGISRLFEAGFDIPRVALVSGHRDWRSLRRYTSIRPESLHQFPSRPA